MGFLGTAGRAWREAQRREDISEAVRGNLQWLGIEVHLHHLPIYLHYAERYPAVQRYLFAIRHRMSDVLRGWTPHTPHPKIMREEVEAMLQKFPERRETWEEWLRRATSDTA